MGAILQSLGRTITAGVVLLVIILGIVGATSGTGINPGLVIRWLHVLSGILWIGLLYYFNFVQMPSMPKIPDEQKPAVSKVIAPTALFWFRWAALSTVVFGLVLAGMSGYLGSALMFTAPHHTIGIGMWLGLIMAFNVWFIIWPNQQKALGLVEVAAEAKPKAARMAMLTSRFNTMLSIPMLYSMVAYQNGGF